MHSRHLLRAGIGCALLAAVVTSLVIVRWAPLLSYDGTVARSLHADAVGHPAVTSAMRVLTDWVWDPWTMRALAAVACGWLWWRGDRRRALLIAGAAVAALLLSQGMKALVGRHRPIWPDPVVSADYAAYPSGHALTAAVVCPLLLWLVPRSAPKPWRLAAWILALASVFGVGFTRIFLGVHWLSDVLGGWLLGVALAVAVIALPDPRNRPKAAAG
ncbi:phosphatase PAP2 family protein [Streptomyces sp. NPDC046866]|uniref:phosphatase PAP2 family protein n=1 Tax=Streptomyces sp. NPDC046866 TaxID=3154921 RepID=UPI003451FA92